VNDLMTGIRPFTGQEAILNSYINNSNVRAASQHLEYYVEGGREMRKKALSLKL